MNHEKSVGAVLAETKDEIREFMETRLQLLWSEVTEKMRIWKHSVPLLLLAGSLLLIGWVVLTFAAVAAIRAWFLPNPYSWVWAGLIVAAIYLVAGGVTGWVAYAELLSAGIAPRRTLQVLKQDQVWIRSERGVA